MECAARTYRRQTLLIRDAGISDHARSLRTCDVKLIHIHISDIAFKCHKWKAKNIDKIPNSIIAINAHHDSALISWDCK